MHRTLPFYFASYPAWQIIKINFYSQRIGDFLPAQQMLSKNMIKTVRITNTWIWSKENWMKSKEVAGFKKILKVRPEPGTSGLEKTASSGELESYTRSN